MIRFWKSRLFWASFISAVISVTICITSGVIVFHNHLWLAIVNWFLSGVSICIIIVRDLQYSAVLKQLEMQNTIASTNLNDLTTRNLDFQNHIDQISQLLVKACIMEIRIRMQTSEFGSLQENQIALNTIENMENLNTIERVAFENQEYEGTSLNLAYQLRAVTERLV